MPDEPIVESAIPEDFAAYEKWHADKDKPQPEPEVKETPAAVEEPAKTPPPESEPEKEEEHGQKGRGFQRRIDQLTAKIRDLESRLETKPGIASPQPPAEPKAAEEPKAENFDTYDAYVRALSSFVAKQEWQQLRDAQDKAEQQRAARAEAQKAQDAWEERRVKVSEKYTDWEDVVGAAAIPVSQALHDALLTSEHGPEIAYTLAKDPAEAKRLFTLSPLEQIRTVGRLEARFEASPEPDKPKVSKAPKPPTPITGGTKSSAPDIHDETLASDYTAWERVRNAQLRRR